jgi:uncharacterized circularly permuted ATP-grasp superfamily protein/uncharacterized alpha-E superfamily protein
MKASGVWNEIFDDSGAPRPAYEALVKHFSSLPPAHVRELEDRIEATLRELGVTFNVRKDQPWGQKSWHCDILPQVFSADEWEKLSRGFVQRLQAFECFLQDIYSKRLILKDGTLPVTPVLGSPHFQGAATGLKPARGAFLHLSGLCLTRLKDGSLAVRHHYFSQASGISYMMQNRRALARVHPVIFEDIPLLQIADTPASILEELREIPVKGSVDPTVVLLTPGTGSPAYSEHALLARRMGIPLVQGGDLLVLNDRLFLKTVGGLQRVEIVYTRVADPWLDPLVFRSDSLLGVPGLVQCVRQGTVALVNSIGSQLADDRALLPFSAAIIRYYLGEAPLLPTLDTLWMGDPDQRMLVLDKLEHYHIRPLYGERLVGSADAGNRSESEIRAIQREVLAEPHRFVAQTANEGAVTLCYHHGKAVPRSQDHILFALKRKDEYEVFHGALTRTSAPKSILTASELGGGSKDTWVLASSRPETEPPETRRAAEHEAPALVVTSRVAEGFYWLGRYLERAYHLSYMIGVVESLEAEELNAEERRLYRPVWNQLLPPLDGGGKSKRSLSTALDRFRLVTDREELGSVTRIIGRAFVNADALQDALSPEAWSSLSRLRSKFEKRRIKDPGTDTERSKLTRRLADNATSFIPQFSAIAAATMLADDGWRFYELGRSLECAIVTANAVFSLAESISRPRHTSAHSMEIELSAFLRLLGSRDAYRRVFQMRASRAEVLEILWQHPESPRSVARCLAQCASLLRQLPGDHERRSALHAAERLREEILRVNWQAYFDDSDPTNSPNAWLPDLEGETDGSALGAVLSEFLTRLLDLHSLISDDFLNHQATINPSDKTLLPGLN